MLPWLLRGERLLGRWGALCSSALLLVSPSILYYSRFIRHDIFAATGALLLFIAVVRYIEVPQPRWAIVGGLSIGYLLTTKEISFIVLFVFAIFLGVAIALRVAPFLLAVGASAVVSFFIASKVLHALGAPALPGIPWDQPTGPQIQHFIIQLIEHPVVIAGIAILILSVVVAAWLLDRRRPTDRDWVDGVLGDAPIGSTAAALHELLASGARCSSPPSAHSHSSPSCIHPSLPIWPVWPVAPSGRSDTGLGSRACNVVKSPGSTICSSCRNTSSSPCSSFRWPPSGSPGNCFEPGDPIGL